MHASLIVVSYWKTRVADPGGVDPYPDLTLENRPDPVVKKIMDPDSNYEKQLGSGSDLNSPLKISFDILSGKIKTGWNIRVEFT